MHHFCTYFDSKYLLKGLALYRSLSRHVKSFRLWVLCLDDFTYKVLQRLAIQEIIPISLRDFEAKDTKLLEAKESRSMVEYYFTCTPSLLLYVLKNNPEIKLITYLDADLFFFSNVTPIYEEFADNSILIIGHRFPERLKHLERCGIYNVGLVSFRKDEEGLSCLNWWRERCIETCFDRCEEGYAGDQGYLDDWPRLFKKVHTLQHQGANLAPWNLQNYRLTIDQDRLFIDGQQLIFYHFHGFKRVFRLLYDSGLRPYRHLYPLDRRIKQYIYTPYIHELQRVRSWLNGIGKDLAVDVITARSRTGLRSYAMMASDLLKGNFIFSLDRAARDRRT